MKNIVNAPFVEEMRKTTANMYRLGWDERNGGNISCLLDTDKVAEYLDINEVKRTIPLGFDADPLIGNIHTYHPLPVRTGGKEGSPPEEGDNRLPCYGSARFLKEPYLFYQNVT
jgi:hypothetical protein